MSAHTFVSVLDARYVHVGVADRGDFDRIGMPHVDHGEVPEHGGHVLTKTVDNGTIRVIFQFWLKDPKPLGERALGAV